MRPSTFHRFYGYRKGVGPGSGSISNTVAPSIDSSAVIGTTIMPTAGTWTGNPVLTYQWQRYVSGAWQDISGATTAARAPVDADWGYSLRLAEIPNGNAAAAAYSNATSRVEEVPEQSFAEVLTNGDFSSWTGNNPNGWTLTVAESSPAYYIDEVGSDGNPGTGSARFVTNTAAFAVRQDVLIQNEWYEIEVNAPIVSGGLPLLTQLGMSLMYLYAAGTRRLLAKASAASSIFQIARGSGDVDCVIDSIACKRLTKNTMLTAPSSDMLVECMFDRPSSPVRYEGVYLFARIADMTTGNYFRATYTQYALSNRWDATLSVVVNNTITPLITVNDVGNLNGIRVNFNGSTIWMQKTSDGGANWSWVGDPITNTTHQTATGVNALFDSSFTPGRLRYYPNL